MPHSQIIMRRLMTVPDFSRRAKEQDSISRGIKHHPVMPLLISVALSLLVQAGPTTWCESSHIRRRNAVGDFQWR
jgi:hypothetical protein